MFALFGSQNQIRQTQNINVTQAIYEKHNLLHRVMCTYTQWRSQEYEVGGTTFPPLSAALDAASGGPALDNFLNRYFAVGEF